MGLDSGEEVTRVVSDAVASFGFGVHQGVIGASVSDPDSVAESVAVVALVVWKAVRVLNRCLRSKTVGPSGN